MNWVTGAAVYVCIWWVVVFAVLPWGVKPAADAQPGNDPGAPADPRLVLKGVVTTAIATLLWIVFYVLANSDLITFRGD
jgi:predicted secreted protein